MKKAPLSAGANAAIRVGVSPCLLGEDVRYAGDNARDFIVTEVLRHAFDWVPTCPEVEIGLGIPRPTIQLERSARGTRLFQPETGLDLTTQMRGFCRKRARALMAEGLAGYIFKSRSPSCGIRRAKIYSSRGTFRRTGRGLFAEEMIRRFPLLPVITEVELHDPLRRLSWITRVFAADRLRRLWQTRWTRGALLEFHESYSLTLQAHSASAERRLRRLLAKTAPRRDLRAAYEPAFHRALEYPSSRAKQARVLATVLRRLSPAITARSGKLLVSALRDYEAAKTPYAEIVSLFRHYALLTEDEILGHSNFLFPGTLEWGVRVSGELVVPG